jgi:hypothetical protein
MSAVTVVRSPARIAWWVMFNGVIVDTADRKYQAVALASVYQRKVG